MILAKKLYQAHSYWCSFWSALCRGVGKFWQRPWGGPNAWANFAEDQFGERWRGLPRRVAQTCIHCGKCQEICPQHCWQKQDQVADLIFVYRHCLSCGLCAQICPAQSIKMSHTHQTAVAAFLPTAWTSEELAQYTVMAAPTEKANQSGHNIATHGSATSSSSTSTSTTTSSSSSSSSSNSSEGA